MWNLLYKMWNLQNVESTKMPVSHWLPFKMPLFTGDEFLHDSTFSVPKPSGNVSAAVEAQW